MLRVEGSGFSLNLEKNETNQKAGARAHGEDQVDGVYSG